MYTAVGYKSENLNDPKLLMDIMMRMIFIIVESDFCKNNGVILRKYEEEYDKYHQAQREVK